jgi:hypothetical protein
LAILLFQGAIVNCAELAFTLRPRSAWEAADLGIRLARHWWRPLTLLWLGVALPVLLTLFLLVDSMTIALLLFWWLKPLYERSLLYYLSRAVFNAAPTLVGTLTTTPRLIWQQILSTLTVRRLSPCRSFDTPVVLLEGLTGKSRSRRIAVLHKDKAGSVSFWLTIAGAHVEFFICLGVVATILALVPESVQLPWDELLAKDYIQAGSVVLAMALVAPFYVAGGFGLYLNRRIVLEGWDLELVFKDLQQRHRQPSEVTGNKMRRGRPLTDTRPVIWGVVLVACCSLGMSCASPVIAKEVLAGDPLAMARDTPAEVVAEPLEVVTEPLEVVTENVSPDSARQDIQEILQSPDFRHIVTRRIPQFVKDWLDAEDEAMPESGDLDSWLMTLGENLASVFQLLAWLGVIALALYILYYYRDGLLSANTRLSLRPASERPGHVLNMDIRESTLPAEVAVAAANLWQTGRFREAMALLYRASLSRLVYRHDLVMSKGATEGDCLRRVKAMNQQTLFGYFQHLTDCWQNLAYAHQLPAEDEFEQLCKGWSVIFDPSSGAEGAEMHGN